MSDEWVSVLNVAEVAATVGHKVLYPGERRRVRRGVAEHAVEVYPGRLAIIGEGEAVEGEAGELVGGFIEEGDEELKVDRAVIAAGAIKGIGPKWAEKLAGAGIGSVEELAAVDDEDAATLLEMMGGALTVEQLMDWVGQAREQLGVGE